MNHDIVRKRCPDSLLVSNKHFMVWIMTLWGNDALTHYWSQISTSWYESWHCEKTMPWLIISLKQALYGMNHDIVRKRCPDSLLVSNKHFMVWIMTLWGNNALTHYWSQISTSWYESWHYEKTQYIHPGFPRSPFRGKLLNKYTGILRVPSGHQKALKGLICILEKNKALKSSYFLKIFLVEALKRSQFEIVNCLNKFFYGFICPLYSLEMLCDIFQC